MIPVAKKQSDIMHTWSLLGAKERGEVEAEHRVAHAQRQADALAARLLAANECPEYLKEWGKIHNIPTFAEYTWQAGFSAGMRAAMLAAKEGEDFTP